MGELTRKALVDKVENIIKDCDERQLDITDIEGIDREQLECISECLQYGQLLYSERDSYNMDVKQIVRTADEIATLLSNAFAYTEKDIDFSKIPSYNSKRNWMNWLFGKSN